jgi:large subunit ribosomal protein L3
MAGHMGTANITVQNLKIVATDADKGLIMVRGAVPGQAGSFVLVSDAVKRKLPKEAPQPASLRKAAAA